MVLHALSERGACTIYGLEMRAFYFCLSVERKKGLDRGQNWETEGRLYFIENDLSKEKKSSLPPPHTQCVRAYLSIDSILQIELLNRGVLMFHRECSVWKEAGVLHIFVVSQRERERARVKSEAQAEVGYCTYVNVPFV